MFSTTEKYCEDGGHYVLPSTPKVKAKGLWLPMIVILSLSLSIASSLIWILMSRDRGLSFGVARKP